MRITQRRIALAPALVLFGGCILGAQTLATRHVMEAKLAHSQRILESLMTSDFETLQRESEALSRLTREPGWAVLGTPEYSRYSLAFIDALTDLKNAAQRRDLDAALLHYTAVTMTCYQCHRYIKNARIAGVAAIGDGDDGDGGGQTKPSRHPPAKPPQPPKAMPRAPAPTPHAAPRPGPRVEIYPYPLVFQPDLIYRFPYGLYPYYRWGYPYPPYGYPPYVYSMPPSGWMERSSASYGTIQFDVTPKDAAVIVDGFYAGTVEDLDNGRLPLVSGPHHIELQAKGFQSAAVDIHVVTDGTVKYRATLKRIDEGGTQQGGQP